MILRSVANDLNFQTDTELEDLYSKTAWYFDRKDNKKVASYNYFQRISVDPSVLDDCNLDDITRDHLLKHIQKQFSTKCIVVRATIGCECMEYEGIDATKRALRAGLELSTDNLIIKINLKQTPEFCKF